MTRTSAGLLPYRRGSDGELLVFIAHMGGPLWAKKDAGGWSIVKGEYVAGEEDPRAAAEREFLEETGAPAPTGDWLDLGTVRTTSGKVITAWAVEAPATLTLAVPGTFEMEWPPRSGRRQSFPEVDRAQWTPLDAARIALVSGQIPFLDRLAATLA
ncbi:MAG: NUDIX domain-containing protein [Austwickia sp.]|nr:NUDIX domain-containing protein [Actinomycetota bacterium]MCO5309275.1 NUDIX domain-containing protein [Austwickia sp.]